MDSNRLKVLVVEDNPDDMELIRIELEEAEPGAFDLRHVTRISAAQEALRQGPVDLVLLDLGLPDAEGFDGLDRLHAEFPTIPVVVLTSGNADRRGHQAIERGAQEFMIKGFLGNEPLAQQLRFAVERAATTLRLKRISQRLEAERLKHSR